MRDSPLKFALSAGIMLALAFTFSCSGGDNSGGERKKCGGVVYDPDIYRCEAGELIGKCKGADYYPAYQQCVGGVIVDGSSSSSSSVGSVSSSSVAGGGGSSSSRVVSSSSVVPSSSSAHVSSSSVVIVIPSSSSVAPIVPSSSSAQVVAVSCDMKCRTVVIGSQTWMAENLNCNVSGSKCYDNSETNCNKYGRLYDWATAMNLPSSCNSSTCASQVGAKHRGICPSGWHIPSDADWTALTDYVGGASTAGTKLKSREGWDSYSGVPLCTDIYDFAALPGGGGYSDGYFSRVGDGGYWWSASERNAYNAYSWGMSSYLVDVGRDYYDKYDGLFSVRCLQD